jgi:hypothetical protein
MLPAYDMLLITQTESCSAMNIFGDRVSGFEEREGDTKSVKRGLSEKSIEVENIN